MSVDARRAIVTGAARGIGRGIAERLLRDGYRVAITDRDHEQAMRTTAELDPGGERTVVLEADVSSSASVNAMVEAVEARFGGLDVLVNNAGIAAPADTARLTDDAWQEIIQVNLTGGLYCARAAHPLLARGTGPAIVNIASIAGVVGMARRAGYSSTKAALIGLTRTLAIEWAGDGIRVNAVAPGYVRTAMIEDLAARGVYDLAEMSARVPLGRLGETEEIAACVAFLASAESGYVTGQTLIADGGVSVDGRT